MKSYLSILIYLIFNPLLSGQTTLPDDFWNNEIEKSTDIIKPNIISTHPLGIYISRINHNFKVRSPEKYSFSFDYSSGNVVLPYVKSYELTNPSDQELSASIIWYNREFNFDLNNSPSKIKEFEADGVIRSYRFTFSLPLNTNHELTFSLRSYSLDKGRIPFSIFTSDELIEWFHRNIAGGKDPFSRYYYGINQAGIKYKDEDNQSITMNKGDFIIPGLEINHSYYPTLGMNKKHHLYLNFNTHLGINTSKYNPVADIGISASLIKKHIIRNKNIFTSGLSAGALKQNLFHYGNRVNISNQKFLYSMEAHIDYKTKLKNSNSLSYGLNYTFQTAYNNPKDFKHIVFTGQRINTHWQQTLYHLYENLHGLSFLMTYSVKKISYYAYIREDNKLDNAPDLQTGIGLKVAIANKTL